MPFLQGLAASSGLIALALVARLAAAGLERSLGVAPTYFPALVVITVYAGAGWGWASLAAAAALAYAIPTPLAQSMGGSFPVLFAACGALTVLVSAVVRRGLLELSDARDEHERMLAALTRSEARLKMVQEAGGVALWDAAAGSRRWSPDTAFDDPIRVGDFEGVVHEDDRAAVRQAIARAQQTGHLDPVEYRLIGRDGPIRWLLSRGEILRDGDGRPDRAVGVDIDVTERRRTFERLQESEARFRAMADSAPFVMWVSNVDGGREFVNRTFHEYLGLTYEDACAADLTSLLHPDDVARTLARAGQSNVEPGRRTNEARFRRADGEWRWFQTIIIPRHDADGTYVGMLGVGFDTTDARRASEDLLRINELLADRVAAALGERDQAEAALRRAQKLEAVGQLTGGVAHDFNNLLTVIIGALDLMQRHPDDVSRRTRMIEAALGAARRGERLTQQLLAFSRRQPLKSEALCVDDLVAEMSSLLRRAVGEAVDLTVETRAGKSVALIDPSQFESALMNLVVNARDAVGAAGAIRVETAVRALAARQVEELPGGPYVCVTVADTGAGMSEAVLARVFEPFFTTKEVGKGTGLGLSQVYGFARQSGGGVAIDSAEGRGTAVTLYLPLSGEAADAAASDPPPLHAGPRLNVLLVEDDPDVGDLIAAMLEDLGHGVLRAGEADQGLALLRERVRIDLLLTDVVMPGGRTGVDLARDAVALRPDLPVILSSGYTGDVLQSAERAPWPLLRKPYSAEALARAIEQVLERPAQNV